MAMASIKAKDMTGIGLMIGELGFSAVRCGPAGEEPKLIESTANHAPMSVLVPRLPGEPLRLDCVIPLHPRGTGCEWPPEAGIDEERGCGRFPLAAAWAGLPHGRAGLPHGRDWVWHIDGHEQPVRPAEAIAAAVTDILKLHPTLAGNGVATLVIPNSTREAERQALLDSADQARIRLQLLWRPVAAALAWCHRFDDFLRDRVSQGAFGSDDSIGRLVCLHVGLADLELTVLDLVLKWHEGQAWITPARRRPDPRLDVTSGFGWLVLEDYARRFLSAAGLPADRQQLWQLLVASNWPSSWLESFEHALGAPLQSVTMPTGLSVPTNDARPRYLPGLPIPQGDGHWQLLGSHRVPQSSPDQIRSWSNRCIQELPEGIIGAAVSGEMAAVPLQNEVPLGRALLEPILGTTQRLLLGGEFLGRRLLAQGAAMFSARLAAGLPTYFDTLPQLKLLVRYQNGEMAWVDLLEGSHKYVDGDRPWTLPEPVVGLAIERRKPNLTFAVYHEEYTNIRKLSVDIPRTSEEDEPVELKVSITPAQGNACLEVCPKRGEIFGTRSIRVNWKRMEIVPDKDGGNDRQRYIDLQPRIYPDLHPRLPSRRKWIAARLLIWEFFEADQPRRRNEVCHVIGELKKKLGQPDQQEYPREFRAVSSDGRVDEQQPLLDRLIDRLWVRLRQHADAQEASHIVRCLAYASADRPDYADFLVHELNDIMRGVAATRIGTRNAQRSFTQAILLGCGHCLRTPVHTANLAQHFVTHFQRRGSNSRDWLQALGAVLRYRKEASRDFSPEACSAILETCWALLQGELDRARNGGHPRRLIFKHAALVIAFMLRRRAFDAKFLDPTTDLARRIKQTCMDAIEARTLLIPGGAIDLRKALQQIVDYIDRRGIGTLIFAAPDDMDEGDIAEA